MAERYDSNQRAGSLKDAASDNDNYQSFAPWASP
jgi:hypothetical protein